MANSQSSTFVTVTHGEETIKVGSNIFDLIPTDLQTSVKSSKYAVVLDENVNRLYGERFREAFTKANVPLLVKVIAPGESSKCRRVKEDIEDFLISNGFNRDSCIIALGGGVIGDLAGFVASTYMRGIPFVQIPTTLLAMVDSSIGGKTAIDTDAAKNIIGAFHHPKVIYLDVSFLKTLPQREFCNGMAEVIKTAAIRDSKLFELLENNTDRILERDTDLLQKMILATASIKLEVVAIDPHEKGVRCILNFGHTIGHAIEALVTPELLHGECVSIGMILETKLAHQMGHLKHPSTVGRLLRCVQSYKLPIHIPKYLQVEKVIHKMTLDKKNANSKIRCVILKGIADVFETPVVVEPHVITQVLSPYISVVPGKVSGEISVPGSKSISNRVLPICGLGEGTCRVKGLLNADDTRVMLDSLLELGVGLAWEDDGQTLVVTPSGKLTSPSKALFLGNAGTASRFLTTMCTIIEGGKATLTGTKRLTERPIKHLTTALLNNGCKIKFLDKEGFFPLEIEGTGFPGGTIELNANVSSQYVSSILLSAPYAKQPVTLHLQDKAVSRPFIDMTLQVMAQFGIQVEQKDADTYVVPQGIYKNPAEFVIESDASSASYPLAMAAITGGTVTVHNIGKNSIQGDAKFYTVLQMMGCEASQTVTSTTVTGPVGKPLKAVDVDMGDMTDTFMTVCALAAVADGVTRITNIANQRVKECNRIAAMVTELTKCGVQASELEDGLEIVGCAGDYSKLHGAHIECYLDHRIAMSFAVLGCVVPGIVITDKECTDKTYPEFWYDVEKNFNLKLKSVVPQQEKQEKLRDAMYLSNKGVIIVGMRGSGKTSNARALANALSRPLVDLDEAFQVENKMTIQQFVDAHGWPEFRKKEEELFKKIVAENVNKGTIISTGGGLVESSTAREALRNAFSSYIVVQLHRDINDIVEYLGSDKTRANLGEEVMSIWNRRSPLYKESSQFEFCMEKGEKNWKTVENNFISFVKKILQRDFGDTLSPSDSSFFLCLSYPDLREVSPEIIHKLASSVDAFELRVDLLRDTSADSIKSQIAYLRSHTVLPIIFTVRSQSQGGSFNGTEDQYFELLSLGARVHCEFIDVEVIWSTNGKSKFLSELKDRSIVIVSYHNYQERITPEKLKNWVSLCKNHDIRDPIIKIVAFAHSFEDNFLVHDLKVNSPYIAICAGEKGKLSRVLNNFLTPVTHELLPVKAAPGQLSAQEILRLRSELSISPASVPQQNYYLFGSPISRSRSPLMHNTGFAHYSLPHVYQLCETESIDVVAKQLNDKSTFGGSVTIPHKQTVLPYMTCLSDSAKAIGAVNTVKKLVDGSFYGDNTDWLAIYKLVKHKLGAQTRAKGLVVGAGGTAHAACYALNQLQIPFFIYNRTGEKAQKLAQEFGGTAITDLKDITDSVQVVVSTVPSSAEFQVPQHLAHKDLLVVELSYYPRFTKMLQQATENGFKYVEGIELLLEQGLAQFEIWTKKKAPRKEIVEAFLKSNDGELAANPPNFVNDDSVFQ